MPQQQWSGKHVKEDPLDEFYNPDGSLKDIPGLGGRRPARESLELIQEHCREAARVYEAAGDQVGAETQGRIYVLCELLREAYERIEKLELEVVY